MTLSSDAQTTDTNLPPRKVLQAWIERTFPDETRPDEALGSQHRAGYYAASQYGSPDHAQLRYYNGGSQREVERKLQAAAAKLDERGASYTWQTGSHDYKYLLVSCSVPEPAPSTEPDELSL
jgi:hypothetical protein